MIPKVIHYCWFGKNPLPKTAKNCIASWKKYCPDYEIKEWNEDNFDINSNAYVKEAYETGKYAFVSDYVRLYALYNFGGIYMDTDVEVVKSFDDILDNNGVFGFEEREYIATSFMASEYRNNLIKEFLGMYENEVFKNSDGTLNTKTNVGRLTEMLMKYGLVRDNTFQEINGNVIYPKEYFSPYDYINCIDERTHNTYCVHWFEVSWMSGSEHIKKMIKKNLVKLIGKKNMEKIRGMMNR